MKNYTVLENGYIQYQDNDFLITIPNNPANSDYQRYLRWLENPNAVDNPVGGSI